MKENTHRRIFCIGLSRTGTTSLHLALVALGYPAIHYPASIGMLWLQGDFSTRTTANYQAYSDIPTGIFFKQLHESHPEALFIYTRRDPEAWANSVERHISNTPPPSQYTILRDYIRLSVYGTLKFTRNRFIDQYRNHEERVMSYFKDYPERLLVLNIDDGLSWEPICSFLNEEIPNLKFPRATAPNIGNLQTVGPNNLERRREELRSMMYSQ